MKAFIILCMVLFLTMTGCAVSEPMSPQKQYQATFYDLFDTVTVVVGTANNEEQFYAKAQKIHDELLRYHQLFDIYNEYDGISNIRTINENAGIRPIEVDPEIVELLLDCQMFYEETDGRVNIAMGSVLELWHEARNNSLENPVDAYLPDQNALREAFEHTDITRMEIDKEAGTVFLADSQMRLDVGAVAKGWAVQKVAERTALQMKEEQGGGLLISVGGNVCVTGPKDRTGASWNIGIQNPDSRNEYLHTVRVASGSVVTSGDYQRTYEVGGKQYHHIIDPNTLYPSEYWRSVTIICQDSGIADMLSTAAFLMDQESGQELLDRYSAQALWIDCDGNKLYSHGF